MAYSNRTSLVAGTGQNTADLLSPPAANLDFSNEADHPATTFALQFDRRGDFGCVSRESDSAGIVRPKLFTLVNFAGVITNGQTPRGSLLADAAGNLFGTTQDGHSVFEIKKTTTGYAKTPTVLVNYNGSNEADLYGSLTMDAAGDFLGTTMDGGVDGDGTVFEIKKTASGYSKSLTTVITFTGSNGESPEASLNTDAAGDLFGTTVVGGVDGGGTVFEIKKTASGFAKAPTVLVNFDSANGFLPFGGLISDAAGDLFGTTTSGGPSLEGTIFEIKKTGTRYATVPTTLVSFTGTNGSDPYGSLITDPAGDLFGTTQTGGVDNSGTVFEIAKTTAGYATKPIVLVNFTGADGANPFGSLIADAAGNLFGTTSAGGANGGGTVFKIATTVSGYAKAPTTLVNFTGVNGSTPVASLIADAAGDLFGTASAGGTNNDGTVYEITNSGFVNSLSPAATTVTPAHASTGNSTPLAAAFVQAMASYGSSRPGSDSLLFVTSRNEISSILCRPQVA